MLKKIINHILYQNEKRIGVKLDYARKIVSVDTRLFMRYGKVFGFLDPRKHLSIDAYHASRLCGALSADCGSCVEAEINLAQNSGLSDEVINHILTKDLGALPDDIVAVVELSTAVTNFLDAPEAREKIIKYYGEKGLIELSFAMNGAALLPGIKRAMGYATSCNLEILRRVPHSKD
ncbi:hypothetical protein [Thalassomonas haliotis]|uniref:Carboxymuconolactone decarboxylase-like domain-containing protein n=1 Tax=Thalassomonas haliotis TaxID=485448 RepID=A0ABY7VBY2_9GAMM|nr:hypothetical protein [Thalassomonas haliotis]WDE10392.1 hypothetical protein H3N35_19240 [Thalassomonas haliotis]